MSDLPRGWTTAALDQVALLITDGDHNPPKRMPEGVPHLTARNVRDGKIVLDRCTFISQEDFARASRRYTPLPGDVIVTCVGTLGQTAVVPGGLSFNADRNLAAIRPSGAIMSFFLKAALDAPGPQSVMRNVSGSTAQPHLYLSDLRKLHVPVPPLAEQARIVDAIDEQLSRLDAGVAALGRVQQNLRRMRSAAFSLVTDSTDARRPLGEIAEVVGGVTKDAKRQTDASFVEVPYLRVANVQRGYLDLAAVTTIRVPAPTVEKLRLEPGDILFNEGGDRDKLGRGWVWEGQIRDCIHQNHVFRARLRTDEFEPKFISMHGNTFGRTWFEKMGKQTTNLASLNLTTLKSFPVPDLPVGQQREIVAEVERQLSLLDSLQSVADHSLMRCGLLRSSILSAAFSGQLVAQDPSEEPASVLLERIKADDMGANGHKPRRTRGPRASRETITT